MKSNRKSGRRCAISFADLLGNETVIHLLKGQQAGNRLASTYLFVGPRGIGKKRIALEFAKAVECEDLQHGESCEKCPSCMQINKGVFPDLHIVSRDSDSETGQVKIDQVRALIHWMSLTPDQNHKRIGLIEQADQLTEEAAHACLKLLEEPMENSLILLTATASQGLPATLISRCHIVRCVPQGIEKVSSYLEQKEGLGKKEAMLFAVLSGGRLGLALGFHRENRQLLKNRNVDQILSAWRARLVEIPLGSAPRQEIEEALEWTAAWWRDLIFLSLGADPELIIHQDRLQDLEKELVTSRLSLIARAQTLNEQQAASDRIDVFLKLVDHAYVAQRALQDNVSPRIALAELLSR